MTQRRVYEKLNFNGETYENAIFYGNEFRYAWIPTTRHMKDLMAMERRRSSQPARTWRFGCAPKV